MSTRCCASFSPTYMLKAPTTHQTPSPNGISPLSSESAWQSSATRKIIPRENFWSVCATRKMPEKRLPEVRPEPLDDIVPVPLTARDMQHSPFNETPYRHSASYSPVMLAKTLRQVCDASIARSIRLRS